jgi:hypothetical protein
MSSISVQYLDGKVVVAYSSEYWLELREHRGPTGRQETRRIPFNRIWNAIF